MTTVDAMIRRLAAGDTKEQAATFAYKNLAAPMLTGTLITIAGFVPIGFARSSAGEYTFSIFAVVAIALVISWLVAVIFAPLIGIAILKAAEGHRRRGEAGGDDARVPRPADRRDAREWLTIAVTIVAFAGAVYLLRFVPPQFFPASDRPELLVDLTLPQNASIYASEDVAQRLEATLAKDPDVEHWSTYVGRGAIRFYLPLDVQLANPFFAQVVVVAKDFEARKRLHDRAREAAGRAVPRRGVARLAARAGAAGRLAGAVPRERSGQGRGHARSRCSSPRWWRRTRRRGTSTSTGWSRRGSCA